MAKINLKTDTGIDVGAIEITINNPCLKRGYWEIDLWPTSGSGKVTLPVAHSSPMGLLIQSFAKTINAEVETGKYK